VHCTAWPQLENVSLYSSVYSSLKMSTCLNSISVCRVVNKINLTATQLCQTERTTAGWCSSDLHSFCFCFFPSWLINVHCDFEQKENFSDEADDDKFLDEELHHWVQSAKIPCMHLSTLLKVTKWAQLLKGFRICSFSEFDKVFIMRREKLFWHNLPRTCLVFS
jgi:hypothetical protein